MTSEAIEQQTQELRDHDEGRQVPPHRSGRSRMIDAGPPRFGLSFAAALALSSAPVVRVGRNAAILPGDRSLPDNRGRRAEKDAAALAKAEAKRERKAAKRAAQAQTRRAQ